MTISSTEVNTDEYTNWQIYRRLLAYARPYLAIFAASIVGFLLFSAMQVLLADVMQYLIDAVGGEAEAINNGLISGVMSQFFSMDQDHLALTRYLIPGVLMLIMLVRGLGSFIGKYGIDYVGRSVVHDIRCDLFNSLVKLPCTFFDRHASGHLVSRVTFNVEQVTGAVTSALTVVVREGLYVIFLLSYLIYLNWKLTLVFFIVAPMLAIIVKLVSGRFRRISRRIQRSMGSVTHVTNEVVFGYREMRMFGGESYERQRFYDASSFNRRQSIKMSATQAVSTPVIQMVVGSALSLLVFLLLDPKVQETMTPGQFVAFLVSAGLLAKPVRQLSEINSIIQRGLAAAHDIFAQLDAPQEVDEGRQEVSSCAGRIEFRDVSFRYDGDLEPVLKHINLVIEPGQTVAFVGKSGSGKTTLVSLLPRFYTGYDGQILLDGQPIEALKLTDLRRQIGLVNQQVTLFNDTVKNNIAYGGLAGATDEDLQSAIQSAYADQFIDELDQAQETIIGDHGVMLSGGQRQRLAIARALLKDAPVLILDEATSALDNESERFIQQALEEVMRNRTTLVIAHRLSTIEKADKIIVMEDGEIVEQGSHQQLLAAEGRYAQLHRRAIDPSELSGGH